MQDADRIAKLERDLASVTSRLDVRDRRQLKYPLDVESVGILRRAAQQYMPDLIFDMAWQNVMRHVELFDSIDGFYKTSGVSLHTTATNNYVTFTTAASADDRQVLAKVPTIQRSLTWAGRSNVRFSAGMDTATQCYFIVGGDPHSSPHQNAYGFRVENGTMYGVTVNFTNGISLVTLGSRTSSTTVFEARYQPQVGVDFFVDFTQRGSQKDITKIPENNVQFGNQTLMYLSCQTLDATAHSMLISLFDFQGTMKSQELP